METCVLASQMIIETPDGKVMSDAMQTESPWAYHVMARSAYGDVVFRDDQDYTRFLRLLAEACGRTGWRMYA